MRTAYQEQLEALTSVLGEMCELAGTAMARATQALLQADLAIAEEVIGDTDRMSRLTARAEEQSFALLALPALGLLGYVLVRSMRDRQTREVTAHKTSAR